MDNENKIKFGHDIREARARLQLKQIECARHCGVSIVSFQNWERGICEPKPDKMELICGFLGLNREDYE